MSEEAGRQGSSSQRTSAEPEKPPLRVMNLPDAQVILTSQDEATQEPAESVDFVDGSQKSPVKEESEEVKIFLFLFFFFKAPISQSIA